MNYKKWGVKKLITAILAVMITVSIIGTGIGTGTAGLRTVNAGGRSGDYGIREAYDDSERTYPNAVFGDDYFDANGKITLEFKAVSGAGEYTLLVQDETAKKVYLNSNYWGFNNETYHISYLIINNEKLVKCNGTSVVLSKSDFKKNSELAPTYGEKFADVTIGTVTSDIKEQWYHGFWFDGNNNCTYSGLGSWKGSGDWQWYEDSTGWYPSSCWQRMDKLYKPYEGNGHPACASTGSRSWGSGKMYITSGWFYFDENGYAVRNGWQKIDGSWYYFDDFLYEGGCWRDGYYLGYDGIQSYQYTGSWKGDSSGWWYEDTSGWYPANEKVIIDGAEYYFKSNGYMAADEWLAPGTCGNSWDSMWIHVNSSGVEDKTGRYDENNVWHED